MNTKPCSTLMSLQDRLDSKWAHPEIEPFYESLNTPAQSSIDAFDVRIPFSKRKQDVQEATAAFAQSMGAGLDQLATKKEITGMDGNAITLYIAPPEKKEEKMPCLLIIPGGALTMCAITAGDFSYKDILNAVVITTTYRTIYDFAEFESGYPGMINDLDSVYQWILNHADELNIDPDKIVMYGASSGAHLGLALCHRLKANNYYGHMPRGILAYGCIVDEDLHYETSGYTGVSWNGQQLNRCLTTWLGSEANLSQIPAEAIANHATTEECIGLPPHFLHIEANDPSAAPTMAYASKLLEAGVYTDVHVWGGAGHANLGTMKYFNPDASYVQRYDSIFFGNLKDALQYDLRHQWIK